MLIRRLNTKINNQNFLRKKQNNKILSNVNKSFSRLNTDTFVRNNCLSFTKSLNKNDIKQQNEMSNREYLTTRLVTAKGAEYGPGMFELSKTRFNQIKDGLTQEQIGALSDRLLDRFIFYMGEEPDLLDNFDFLQSLSPTEIKKIMNSSFARFNLCFILEDNSKSDKETEKAKYHLVRFISCKTNNTNNGQF